MRFWQKLYLSILALFLLVFVLSVSVLVHSIYENNLSMEREKGNSEARWLEGRISKEVEAQGQELLSGPFSFSYDYLVQNSLFTLYFNNELIYTNLDFDDSTLIPSKGLDSAMAKVYWQQDKSYYCVYMPVTTNPEYTLLYLHELTGLSRFMDELNAICLAVAIAGSILLAVLLYFLVKKMTNPLEKLDMAALDMASGKYETRVAVKGKDEFASVGNSFNAMAAQVQQHIAFLEEENEKKQLFIDNFAHEMNTPLTSIRGYGEYLQRGMVTQKERYEALSFIIREATRLSAMGKQLLLLADIREGDFCFETLNVKELIDSLQKLFAERLRQKEITIDFSDTVETVCAVGPLLESLAANLIENAIRACQAGGRIQVAFEKSGEGWSLTVSDNGRGIPQESIPYVWEPFYRTDKARSRADGGAGLGLTLCRQIARLHHASICIDTKEDVGTRIRVNFTTS